MPFSNERRYLNLYLKLKHLEDINEFKIQSDKLKVKLKDVESYLKDVVRNGINNTELDKVNDMVISLEDNINNNLIKK